MLVAKGKEIASAYLALYTKMPGLKSDISNQLGAVLPAEGRKAGSGFLSGFKASFAGNVLAGAALKVASGIGGLVRSSVAVGVSTAAATEQAKIGFETMLGSAAKADVFIKQMADFAAKTPFDMPGLQRSASTLVAAGIDSKKIIPIMRTLGDVTSGVGTGAEGISRATVALQQMNAAQKISGEDLAQLRDAGIPVYDLLASALGKTKAEVAEMASKGKLGKDALDAMMKALESGKGLEKFSGLMDKQSKSLTGLRSTLKDTFEQGMAKVIEPLVPLIKFALAGAITLTEKATAGLARGINAIIAPFTALKGLLSIKDTTSDEQFKAINAAVAKLPAPLQVVLRSITAFRNAWSNADGDITSSGLPGFMERLAYKLRTLQDQIKETVAKFVHLASSIHLPKLNLASIFSAGSLTGVLATVKTFGPLISIVTRLAAHFGGLKAIVSKLVARFGGLGAIISKVAPALRLFAGPVGVIITILTTLYASNEQVRTAINNLLGTLIQVGIQLVTALLPVITQLANLLLPIIGKLLAVLAPVIGQIVVAIGTIVATLATALVPIINLVLAIIGGLITVVIPPLIWIIQAVATVITGVIIPAISLFISLLQALLMPVINALLPLITVVFGGIKSSIVNVMKIIQGIIRTVTALIRLDWSGAWNGIKQIFSGIWNQIKNMVSTAFNLLKAIVSGTLNLIVAFVTGIPGRIFSALGSLASLGGKAASWFGSFLNGAKNMLGQAVSFVASIPGKILSALGNIGSTLFNSGKSLISGFTDGIKNAFSSAYDAVKNGLSYIRSFLPFSPAKRGPFSGKGYTLYSGRKLITDFAKGIDQRSGLAASSLRSALDVGTLSSLDAPQFGGQGRFGLAQRQVQVNINLEDERLRGLLRAEVRQMIREGGFA